MKICISLSESNENEANPDLMAPPHYEIPKNPADGHIFLLCIVSRRLSTNSFFAEPGVQCMSYQYHSACGARKAQYGRHHVYVRNLCWKFR